MSVRRPCCVGSICVLVYLVGGVVVAAAVTVVGLRPVLQQQIRCFQCCCPDGAALQHFCWSVKRHESESAGCVHGWGFGSGPQMRKASMCQDYCGISRLWAPVCLKQSDSPNYQKKTVLHLTELKRL